MYCIGVYRLEIIKIHSKSLFDGDDLLVIKTGMDEQEVTVYSPDSTDWGMMVTESKNCINSVLHLLNPEKKSENIKIGQLLNSDKGLAH